MFFKDPALSRALSALLPKLLRPSHGGCDFIGSPEVLELAGPFVRGSVEDRHERKQRKA
jgi:hypothetical protein